MRYLPALALFAALPALAPAIAVPPPPPMPEVLEPTQAILHAMTAKDIRAYDAVLADSFVGYKNGDLSDPQTREAWLKEMTEAFANPAFGVRFMQVFQGSVLVGGKLRQQVVLVEHVSNYALRSNGIPGDCCGFYVTETITIDGGKVVRIDRSPLYDNELSATGERTDIRQPGAPRPPH